MRTVEELFQHVLIQRWVLLRDAADPDSVPIIALVVPRADLVRPELGQADPPVAVGVG